MSGILSRAPSIYFLTDPYKQVLLPKLWVKNDVRQFQAVISDSQETHTFWRRAYKQAGTSIRRQEVQFYVAHWNASQLPEIINDLVLDTGYVFVGFSGGDAVADSVGDSCSFSGSDFGVNVFDDFRPDGRPNIMKLPCKSGSPGLIKRLDVIPAIGVFLPVVLMDCRIRPQESRIRCRVAVQ
jgi:hypothetical protein